MSKTQKDQKRQRTVLAHKRENERLIEQIRQMNQAIANHQFMLACLIHQGGGLAEISEETMEFVKKQTAINFMDQFDELRKVYVFRVIFGDEFEKKLVEKIKLGKELK